MGKKIVIVGGVAGGASAATRIRRLDEQADITIFEKGPYASFSNCALPYYLGGVVERSDSLVLMDPPRFLAQYNIDVRVNSEVLSIDRAKKTVTVRDLQADAVYTVSYDKLILSPGAKPILPASIPGTAKPHVFTVRNVPDIVRLKEFLSREDIRQVAVVGGGFIGVEIAENLTIMGKSVTIVEAAQQIMAPFDDDMVQILHKELLDHQVQLLLSAAVREITDTQLLLSSGQAIAAQAVVMAIGVVPETDLAQAAGLELGQTGGIQVNPNYQTSDEDIYAVGDAIEVYHRLSRAPTRLALAGPAQRQARSAADHMYGQSNCRRGVIGSSAVRIFGLNAASTGMNEKQTQAAGIPYGFAYVIPMDKVSLMPDKAPLHFKLLYEYPTGRLLGAQAIGKGNADKRIDVIAAMIHMNATLEDLKELELCYSPLFGTARDAVNQAALVGLNLLYGPLRQVNVAKARELVENGAFIVDVREPAEFARGHLINAVNIPLSQLRDRLSEIPRDIPVYLHCRSGQRSYNACMVLINNGYRNVFNISGSYLGICLYEYFRDTVQQREKIVTEYNFS